jgi:gallate decarboxylase subunit D
VKTSDIALRKVWIMQGADGGAEFEGVRSFDVAEADGPFRITARVLELGQDCLVVVWGGTRPHVGAVGMAQFRPSLKDSEMPAATSSVFTYLGHKEDTLAKSMSEELTRRLGRNTVVVAGIHWDDLSGEEIQVLVRLSRTLTDDVLERLSPREE